MGFENVEVDAFANKLGGLVKSVTLVQKRIRELQRGWPKLIRTEELDIIQVAVEELRNDKIWLVSGEEAEELSVNRAIEERDRARAIENARRTAELESVPVVPEPGSGISQTLGLKS